jgi:2,3-bisphosphoglycerate-independent phosphoglycerate mutase
VPGTTGSYDSQFHKKGEAVCNAVTNGGFDFGFVHVKAVDDTGHDRLWGLRIRYIELMDRLLGQIIKRLHIAEHV